MTTAAPSDDTVDGAAGEKLPGTPTQRWAKTDATQQRILDATTDVFAASGFTAATMADIVDHSGDGYRLTKHGRSLMAAFEPLQAWAESWARQVDI